MAGSHSRREFLTLAGAAAASAGFGARPRWTWWPPARWRIASVIDSGEGAASLHHRLAPALRRETRLLPASRSDVSSSKRDGVRADADVRLRRDETRGRRPRRRRDPVRADQRRRSRRGRRDRHVRSRRLQGHQDAQPAQELGRCLGIFRSTSQLQDRKLLALFHTGIAFHIEEPQYTSMARMRPAYLDTISRVRFRI